MRLVLPRTSCFIFLLSFLHLPRFFLVPNGGIVIRRGKKRKKLRAKPASTPLVPPRISHEATQD
jgi:hypothetical protein